MRGFGAEVIVHGHDYQAAREHAEALASERGLHMVPPYHRDLVVGVATCAAELFEAEPALDALYVPVGMGSGIAGAIAVRDLLGLRTEVVGVVAASAPATARSFEAGHVVTTESARTFVDGVACRVPVDEAIEVIVKGAARVVEVSEDAAADAMRVLFDTTHNVPEPAGALALAGLLAERDRAEGRGARSCRPAATPTRTSFAQCSAARRRSPDLRRPRPPRAGRRRRRRLRHPRRWPRPPPRAPGPAR